MDMPDKRYVVMFSEPGGPTVYAGRLGDGALGFAPSLLTAEHYDSEDAAQRHLSCGYGEAMREIGSVVEVTA